MKTSQPEICSLECFEGTCPGQWLYLLEDGGVVYSEPQNRFAGLDAAGVAAYLAFDDGARVEDLEVPHDDPTNRETLETLNALSQGIFPSVEAPAPWPAFDSSWHEDPPGDNIEIGDVPVSVHYPSGELASLYGDYFRNCPATTRPPRCYLAAHQEKDGWVIRVNGQDFLRLQREQQVGLGLMHAARTLLHAEGDYDVAFHAAMVARDDRGIMLCAWRESGKSTLAAYLVAEGFELLTDEPALLRLDTWSVQSFPLPISLKEGSWPSLRQLWPQLASAPVHVRSDKTRICLAHPMDASRSAGQRRLTQIVFPRYCPTAVSRAECVSPLHALRLLSEGGMLLAEHMTRGHFEALLRSICLTPAYRLEYASSQDALRLLDEIRGESSGIQTAPGPVSR